MAVLRMLGSFGLGAALMYLFDPRAGRRRRARLHDHLTHAVHANQRLAGKAARDLEHRVVGLVDRVRTPARSNSDRVIAERVRSAIGHVVAHPSAIQVDVRERRVVVRGPVGEKEAMKLIAVLRDVPGVGSVVDQLHRQPPPGTQDLSHGALAYDPATLLMPGPRLLVGGAGLGLLATGAIARGSYGALANVGGALLLARAAANRPLRQLVGLSPMTIDLAKTITIHAPIDRVFALWTHVEEFPRFMEHVQSVRRAPDDAQRTTWVVDGPFGMRITFTARITRLEHEKLLAWQTLPGSDVDHAGTIHFETVDPQAGGGTRVQIQLRYRPPGGLVGDLAARALHTDPRSRIADDLVRAKSLLERGYTRAHHHRIDLDDVILS
jgi:uncharacterized membrane protein